MSHMDRVMAQVNWPLLREQKATLVGLAVSSEVRQAALDGVINLLDAIQDAAVADGTDYELVFGDDDDGT